jgi:hypothetical protein
MHGFAVFIQAGAPGVIPEAAPIILLFKADDLGNFRLLLGRGLEGAEYRKSRGAGADNSNTCHEVSSCYQSGKMPGLVGAPSSNFESQSMVVWR